MAKKSDRKPTVESPIQSRQQQLAIQEAKLKAQLSKTKEFLEKAPVLKDKAQKKQQQELLNRFTGRTPVEGPMAMNFRLEFVRGQTPLSSIKPKKLRKERSKAPLITFVLLMTFVVVAYLAWKSLWQG